MQQDRKQNIHINQLLCTASKTSSKCALVIVLFHTVCPCFTSVITLSIYIFFKTGTSLS